MVLGLVLGGMALPTWAQQATQAPSAAPPGSPSTLVIGVGDVVTVTVYGRPELETTVYVANDGSIDMPLAGRIPIAGLEPSAAARLIEKALLDGELLTNPQVSLTFAEFRSQQISVLGEVRTPGRFPLPTRTTVLDALAQAGGFTELGGGEVVVLRPYDDGVQQYTLDIEQFANDGLSAASFELRGGDTVLAPKAKRFYIYGEVRLPSVYRIEPGMTVMQALSVAGGLTERGSDRRVEIRRPQPDGSFRKLSVDLGDPVLENDVIRVRERIF